MTTLIYAEDGGFVLEERLDHCKVFRWFSTRELAEMAEPTEGKTVVLEGMQVRDSHEWEARSGLFI